MTQTLALYAITATVFLGLDMIGIRLIVRPVFDRHVAHLLADPIRLGPAALFYLAYVAGLLWFVSLPALREGLPLQALIGGMILGFLCYGTYEMTNYATLVLLQHNSGTLYGVAQLVGKLIIIGVLKFLPRKVTIV